MRSRIFVTPKAGSGGRTRRGIFDDCQASAKYLQKRNPKVGPGVEVGSAPDSEDERADVRESGRGRSVRWR